MSEENNRPEESTSENVQSKPEEEAENTKNALKKLADQKPDSMLEVMMGMSSMGNPLHQKMNTEHISKVLDLALKHDERQHDLHKRSQEQNFKESASNRRYFFASFVSIIFLVIFVIYLFRDKPEALVPLLTGIGGLISGFIGGWGLGKMRD